MLKFMFGFVLIALFFACLVTYSFQNILFPAAFAAAANQAAAASIPGYAGEIAGWMLREDQPGDSSRYATSILTPFEGYSGPTGFLGCGPHFLDTDLVVVSSRFHEYR